MTMYRAVNLMTGQTTPRWHDGERAQITNKREWVEQYYDVETFEWTEVDDALD